MSNVRGAAPELRRRNHQDERRTRDHRKAERSGGGRHEDLRRHHPPVVVLMIDQRAREERNHRVVPGKMRVHRLTVMVRCVVCVEMHMRQRSGNRSSLHEHDEHGGGHPATHAAIVVNCPEPDT